MLKALVKMFHSKGAEKADSRFKATDYLSNVILPFRHKA